MDLKSTIVIERDVDGYFVAFVPELPGCHSQARDLDELMDRIKEAIGKHIYVVRSKSTTME